MSLTPVYTFPPKPEGPATIAPATMAAGGDLRCMKGPHAILYEQMADIADGEILTLLAKAAPEWEEYYFIRTSDGTECWAFGGGSTKSGDLSILPVRDAPPLPVITFTVQNNTFLYVVDVFIRKKGETEWGADRLAGSFIAPEGKFTLTITAGFFDVQMKDSMGGILFNKEDIPIGPDSPFSNIFLDYEYWKVFLNQSANYLCRVAVRPLAGEIPMNLTIPEDGILSPGEKVALKALAGFYEVRFYRCEDGRPAAILNTVYIGPIPTPQTIH
ncbi:MAG: hypothetical protein WBM17_06115 [Anaerolineales bacterium]